MVRNPVANLQISNKNKVSFGWKKPLKHIFSNASTEKFRFGAPEATIFEQQIGAVIIDWFYESAGFSFNSPITTVNPEIPQDYIY